MASPRDHFIDYLSVEEVISVHAFVFGTPEEMAEHFLQSRDRLFSALSRPHNASLYEHADLVRQAATLLWGLVMSHAFLDGNKRTGWIATRVFLLLNGIALDATMDERVELVIGIAEHRYDVDAAEAWLRRHTHSADPHSPGPSSSAASSHR